MKVINAILLAQLVGLNITHAGVIKYSCEHIFSPPLKYVQKRTDKKPFIFLDEATKRNWARLRAAWEISVLGAGNIRASLHELDNTVYYGLTAILAKENLLIDGPGGGAKTLAATKLFTAQIRAVSGKFSQKEMAKFGKGLLEIIAADKNEKDPEKRIFSLQFHQTISETKLLGGPDVFKYLKTGEWVVDYSKALISEKNLFAILDEIEKAPVSVQMTLLSVLNERMAFTGNKVVKTLLESIAATTNANLADLVAQALPHEVGGRKAFIDRFMLKIHSTNVTISALDEFLLVRKKRMSAGEKEFEIIDLRPLRKLVQRVEIPKEILNAMSEISVYMDGKYTEKYNESVQRVLDNGGKGHPDYYPPYSGSNRSALKIPNIWESAFIARQIMVGVPFNRSRLTMQPIDILDLAPVLLHGGPDQFLVENGLDVRFLQKSWLSSETNEKSDLMSLNINVLVSNDKAKQNANQNEIQNLISEGLYNPETQTFSYISAETLKVNSLYFDVQKGKLSILDKDIKNELVLNEDGLGLGHDVTAMSSYINLEKNLLEIHKKYVQEKSLDPQKANIPRFAMTDRASQLINADDVRKSSKDQLAQIQEFHTKFLDQVNDYIEILSGKPLTKIDKNKYLKIQDEFKKNAKVLNEELANAKIKKDEKAYLAGALKSIKNSAQELNWLFLGSGSNVKAMLLNMINRKNLMIFGPPGSAKTMANKMVFEKAIEGLFEEQQIINVNKVLAKEYALYLKQFHPMSTEGDIVGRLDLAALERGEGYVSNRTGSLSAKDVLFALLDEFDKTPPGVRTSLLSIMNERKIMDGYEEVASNIIAMVLATNSTMSEFMNASGEFSTAFPIIDRVHNKAYSLNKLPLEHLIELHERFYAKIKMELSSPLIVKPVIDLAKKMNFYGRLKFNEKMLYHNIKKEISKILVKRSDAEHREFKDNPDARSGFFMNTRGESARSVISTLDEELSGAVLLNRIYDGESPEKLAQGQIQFDIKDLKALGELVTVFNPMYEIDYQYNNDQKMIQFYLKENEIGNVVDRLDLREKQTFREIKEEIQTVVDIINQYLPQFLESQKQAIRMNPDLYPSAFSSPKDKEEFLKQAGI